MSRQRRQEQRRLRQRQRRQGRNPAYEPVGQLEFPGVMGFFQRHTKVFFIAGILLMVGSLGGIFFNSQSTSDMAGSTATATATPSSTAEAKSTTTATPTATPVTRRYSAPPEMAIDPAKAYEAVLKTERGDVTVELLPEAAPGYVNNFVFLARNDFYDGLVFHRVVRDFVAQAGDPTGGGSGGPGYSLPEERNELRFDTVGLLSMAKSSAGVSGSQFFVTTGPASHLNGDFTVFGRVTQGLDILRQFQARDPGATQPGVKILDIEIREAPSP